MFDVHNILFQKSAASTLLILKMRCTLDGSNARILAKAIQSLSKFGADLFIEADHNGLQLRSLNSTSSAVGSIKFSRSFFDVFQVNEAAENYCKIAMKACLTLFRNMKQVEQCEMRICSEESKFQVKLKCRLETLKNALISIIENENVTAAVSPENTCNSIRGTYRIFNEMSTNFNAAEEEITLDAHSESLTAKNYIEGSRVNEKFMRSQLKLSCGEFEQYNIKRETTVTFCLKEFRAFLFFAESINENLDLLFNEGGSPIFVKITKPQAIECFLVMSTLAAEDVSIYEECRESEVTEHIRAENVSNVSALQKRKRKNPSDGRAHITKTRRSIADDTTLSNDSILFRFHDDTEGNSSRSVDVARNASRCQRLTIHEDDNDAPTPVLNATALNASQHKQLPLQSEVHVEYFDTEDVSNPVQAADECIAQSPERGAQVRSIFSRCFQQTYMPKEPSPTSEVFVPDSDTED